MSLAETLDVSREPKERLVSFTNGFDDLLSGVEVEGITPSVNEYAEMVGELPEERFNQISEMFAFLRAYTPEPPPHKVDDKNFFVFESRANLLKTVINDGYLELPEIVVYLNKLYSNYIGENPSGLDSVQEAIDAKKSQLKDAGHLSARSKYFKLLLAEEPSSELKTLTRQRFLLPDERGDWDGFGNQSAFLTYWLACSIVGYGNPDVTSAIKAPYHHVATDPALPSHAKDRPVYKGLDNFHYDISTNKGSTVTHPEYFEGLLSVLTPEMGLGHYLGGTRHRLADRVLKKMGGGSDNKVKREEVFAAIKEVLGFESEEDFDDDDRVEDDNDDQTTTIDDSDTAVEPAEGEINGPMQSRK